MIVSSGMNLEIRNVMTVKTQGKSQTECSEKESNVLKDRATCMRERENPSFWNEFLKFCFFLIVRFIFVFSSKQASTEVLRYRAVETVGDLQSTSWDTTFQALDVYFNTCLFSTVMLRPKNLEIRNVIQVNNFNHSIFPATISISFMNLTYE
jgi:hypothetical protein